MAVDYFVLPIAKGAPSLCSKGSRVGRSRVGRRSWTIARLYIRSLIIHWFWCFVFEEELPDACPPLAALDCGYEALFRLVPTDVPLAEHFRSKAAEGKICPPGQDACGWASCSMFKVVPKDLMKLTRIRAKYKFIAEVKIDVGSGVSVGANDHVDFWKYAGFDPSVAVVKVEAFGA